MKLFRIALAWLALCGAAYAQSQVPAGGVMGNSTAAARPAQASTVTSIIDRAISSTRGSVLRRGASGWEGVAPSSITGLPWVSAGTGADPLYQILGLVGGGTGSGTASGARTNLGLGTMATQDASAVAISGGSITGMASPSNPSDVANKSYVDGLASGLHIQPASRLASAAVLPNTPTYANGASGVGATLTAGANSTLTVDATVAALNDVVLVKDQAAPLQNGIYTVTTAGSGAAAWVLTRATYFDQAAEMLSGSTTNITAGSTNVNKTFALTANVTTVGTTAANFALFSTGGVSNVGITPGPGISVSGSPVTSSGNITVNNTGVIGSGTPTIGDLAAFTNTGATGVAGTGYNATQVPGMIPATATVTMTIASPAVITWTSHGRSFGDTIYFCSSNTPATLPTGITACTPGTGGAMPPNSYQQNPTVYYVAPINANTFNIATSLPNAKAGTYVNTTGSQSGTHTAFANSVACDGCIGEHIYKVIPFSGTGSVACNNSTPDTLVASLTLTPGIWKIFGSTGVFGAGGAVFATNHSSYGIGITGIQSTPYGGTMNWHATTNNSNGNLWPITPNIVPVYSTGAINLYSQPAWAGGTATCFGEFHAERMK